MNIQSDLIDAKQIAKIQKDFNEVIKFSQNIETVNSDSLFEQWYKNKERFIKAFGGLIYETPYQCELTKEAKETNLQSLVDDLIVCKNTDLIDFLIKEKEGIFQNEVNFDYSYKGKIIKAGTKLTKSLKHFIEDKEYLDEIQTRLSMMIQESKISGVMCLSVHPLDFLSTSDNNHNWHSCHALDGDYRSGNLNYMADKVTFVCYIRSIDNKQKMTNFGNVKWNSKKWRTLFFLSEESNLLFAGRPYPYAIDLEKVSRDILDPILYNKFGRKNKENPFFSGFSSYFDQWKDWSKAFESISISGITSNTVEKIYFDEPQIILGSQMVPLRDVFVENEDDESLHFFNDLTESSCYTALYRTKNKLNISSTKDIKIKIGEPVMCFECGKNYILYDDLMLCSECMSNHPSYENDDTCICEHCEDRIDREDAFEENGITYCQYCFDTILARCNNCSDYILKKEAIVSKGMIYCSDTCRDEKESKEVLNNE